ncbi:hypothetical protein [Pedobacter sp. KACC 23697]|uniref:Uncharacterized protein n=1 Tax=Pedobacter sp. KACC 23697 TaxID=3149230 RepID=A0AAU7K427_9SPHI
MYNLTPIKARCRYFIGRSGSGTALNQKPLKLLSKKIAVLKLLTDSGNMHRYTSVEITTDGTKI